jgi:hypothetical protein
MTELSWTRDWLSYRRGSRWDDQTLTFKWPIDQKIKRTNPKPACARCNKGVGFFHPINLLDGMEIAMNQSVGAAVDDIRRVFEEKGRSLAEAGVELTQADLDRVPFDVVLECKKEAITSAPSPHQVSAPKHRAKSIYERVLDLGDISTAIRNKSR